MRFVLPVTRRQPLKQENVPSCAGHDKAVTSVAQHPTSSSVAASCGEDRVIKLWSLNDGVCIRTILCKSKPLSVTFSRDGNFIVSSHFDGALHAFDALTGMAVQHLDGVHSGQCVAVVPTSQPFKMVSVGRDNCVCVSDIYHPVVRSLAVACAPSSPH